MIAPPADARATPTERSVPDAPIQAHATEGRTVAVLAVIGATLGGLLVTVILLYVNFPDGYNVPYGLSLGSPDLFREMWPYPSFVLDPSDFARLAALVIVLLWVTYLAGWMVVGCTRSTVARRQIAVVVGTFAVGYNTLLVLAMPPVLSSDIYHYVLFGRMVAVYGLNPYVDTGRAITDDVIWPLVFWHDVPTHYGPLWTLISAGVASIGGESALVTILLFKGIAALCNLANGLLVFLLARRLTGGDGVAALVLYAWNPLILIETAGSGHNDVAMMTLALAGLLLAARGRILLGTVVLVLSVLLKYLSALLLLFFVIRCLKGERTWRQAAGLAARMAAIAIVPAVAAFLPFWVGPEVFDRLITVGAPFKTPVRLLLREWVASTLMDRESLGLARAAAEPYVIAGLHVGFVALLLLLVWTSLARKLDWPRVLNFWGLASLVYMVVVYGWNLPWLLVPTLTTACVALQTRMSTRLLAVVHGLGLVLMLPYAVLVAL